MDAGGQLIHGSSVAFRVGDAWHGVLILGASGAGKSELALELMATGAELVADDQTRLTRVHDDIILSAPAQIEGWIEMRGIGIMPAKPLPDAMLKLVVDLDKTETQRLPERAQTDFLGCAVPRLHKTPSKAFAAGLRHYVLTQAYAKEWTMR